MRVAIFVAALALIFAPTASTSQTTDWNGEGASSAAETVSILATKPTITGDQTFRVVFRLEPLIDTEIPYAVLYTNDGVHGWQAVTSRQRTCVVGRRDGVSNVPSISGTDANSGSLVRYDGARASMGRSRPVYLVADLECDGTIFDGDEVTLQTEFFFRLNLEWQKANYLFDRRVLTQ